jgi:hypothetical protein
MPAMLLLPLMGTSMVLPKIVYLLPIRMILLFGRLISMLVTTFPRSLYLIEQKAAGLIVLMDSS